MPRFAANLSLLFTELPFLDRFSAAADVGFSGVEVLFPYDTATKLTRRALLANGLDFVLMNAPPPNYTGGTPGYAALTGQDARFRSDMKRTMRFAAELRPGLIHVMSGPGEGDDAKKTFVANLQWLADAYPEQRFTIEPLNPVSQPGYFLNDYDLAAEVLGAVDRPNLALQYDAFHAQMIHGDALGTWEKHGYRAAHIQIGAAPDRSEPGRGPVDFPALFSAIDDSGYSGWVSAEYTPSSGDTRRSLGWMPR
ncbi:hydroxypyruvate isomerase family protein [Lutimaribacter marinistellae]|uniref:Hydroxypyruvate isomerase family protein n=1 Tax=Lutimaribacter marinistellae TaxID=1820329 RepID=A0ABV7THL3_9RHOB